MPPKDSHSSQVQTLLLTALSTKRVPPTVSSMVWPHDLEYIHKLARYCSMRPKGLYAWEYDSQSAITTRTDWTLRLSAYLSKEPGSRAGTRTSFVSVPTPIFERKHNWTDSTSIL